MRRRRPFVSGVSGMGAVLNMRRVAQSSRNACVGAPPARCDSTFVELANRILDCDRLIFLAYDSRQAAQLMLHLGGAIAMVDLDSKGVEGLSLIQNLRASFPQLPIVAVSSVLGVA
jgi:hypothetical protein